MWTFYKTILNSNYLFNLKNFRFSKYISRAYNINDLKKGVKYIAQ